MSPHVASASDLQDRLAAERAGDAFLIYRDGDGGQRIFSLADTTDRVTIGRGTATDVWLDWDQEASRVHAELARVGDHWTLVDGGLSRNGSFVNRERVLGRTSLQDGDEIRVGATMIVFRMPGDPASATTRLSDQRSLAASVSPAQRRVLVALCRSRKAGGSHAAPATNQQIADELVLSIPAVKSHLRALCHKLDIEDLPQNAKRLKLVELAFQTGLVTERDL